MAKKSDTWMPFYVTDYLGDTMHLSTVQHGAYLLLLLACWKAGGRLPDDDSQLAAITRMPTSDWRKSASVLKAFFTAADGMLEHGRVMKELVRAKELSDKRASVGKLGGRPPKGKQTETNRFPDEEAKGKQTETHAGVRSLPSPSPSQEEQKQAQPAVVAVEPPAKPAMTPDEIIFGYGVPLLVNAGSSDKHARSFLGKLRKLHGETTVINTLRQCIKAKPLQPLEWMAKALSPPPASTPEEDESARRSAETAKAAAMLGIKTHEDIDGTATVC